MMHRGGAVFVAMVLLVASAWGQESTVSATDRFDQELQRIGSTRDQKTAELDAQDAACLNQFAVTDCQNKVTTRRRQILADLKRQESAVKDAQRRQKAADQIQRSADKAAERDRREAELRVGDKGESEMDRQKAQDEKVQSHRQQAKSAEPKASGPKVASGLDAEAQARNRAAYQEKMQATEKRRQERDQRVRDHGTGGPPLPATP